jgi:hypothetical protein
VLIGAVHPRAPVRKLAHNLRVHKQTLLPLVALRKKLAFLRRVQVLARLHRLVTVREVPTPRCLLAVRGIRCLLRVVRFLGHR